MTDQSVLWRRLDQPGHEASRLFFQHSHWHLTGTAVFDHNQQPCRLDYLVVCNTGWQTVSGKVTGWVGNETVELELSIDSAHRWRLNGTESPAVMGCIDLDLGFSPSTNLLPIRRLDLALGQEVEVRAAWLGPKEYVSAHIAERGILALGTTSPPIASFQRPKQTT